MPAAGQTAGDSKPAVEAEYYGELGCSHCDTFRENLLPAAESETGVQVELQTFDILSASGYERCTSRLAELGYDFTIFPVLIIGNNAYQGNTAVEENLTKELAYFAEHGTFKPRLAKEEPIPRNEQTSGMRLAFIPILLAGLADGINPCAFATLLFFVSFLGLRGRTKKHMFLIGMLFAAGVFASYFLIGLGIFNVLRVSLNLSLFRLMLRIIVSAGTAVFCVLSLIDFIRIRKGKTADMILQLPKTVKDRIHATIRSGAGRAAFGAGVFITGLVVAVLELACTGQVYLPTISFMVQSDASLMGIGSLTLYNIAFILPLLIVLIAVTAGASHQKITEFFKEKIGFTKLALAGVFLGLAVLIWLF